MSHPVPPGTGGTGTAKLFFLRDGTGRDWNIFDLLQIEVHQGTMKLIPICGKCLSNIEILVKKSTYRQKADFKNFNFWSKS